MVLNGHEILKVALDRFRAALPELSCPRCSHPLGISSLAGFIPKDHSCIAIDVTMMCGCGFRARLPFFPEFEERGVIRVDLMTRDHLQYMLEMHSEDRVVATA